MGGRQDITGKRFGRLTAISFHGLSDKNKSRLWFCRCDCGGYAILPVGQLNSGHTKSCGCLRGETTINRSTKHGYASNTKTHPLYYVWSSICQRCTNPKNIRFKDYGGRGIGIKTEWKNNPGVFIDWCIENGWKQGLTIERINNNDGYYPHNCKFISHQKQAKNTRRTVYLTFDNKTLSLQAWAKNKGIKPTVIWSRINQLNWSIEKALTTPLLKIYKKKEAKHD